MVQIYKNSDEKFANDTAIIFLEKDIRIDWSEYWTLHNECFWHDDDLAFSIHEEDFDKLIEAIKTSKPSVKPNEDVSKVMLHDVWDRLTDKQKEVFMWIQTAFSEEIWYRKIYNLCNDNWIEYYDLDLYV